MSKLYFRLNMPKEYDVLTKHSEKYYGVVIDAQVFSSFKNSVSLFFYTLNKPYFIDPVFYKFTYQNYPNIFEKRWASDLSSKYGIDDILQTFTGGLQPSSISGNRIVDITVRVLNFQRNGISDIVSETARMEELIEVQSNNPIPRPEFLLPPYFIISNKGDISTNLKFIDEALRQKIDSEKIYAPIALDHDLFLEDGFVEGLIAQYSAKSVDGFAIWITDLREFSSDSAFLKSLVAFTSKLKKSNKGKEVLNLFGGYFSLVLSSHGLLDGIAQGIGISEFKDPDLVASGGRPRYYVPILRQTLSVDSGAELYTASSKIFSCGCGVCRNNRSPASLDPKELDEHFVLNRLSDIEFLKHNTLDNIARKLEEDKAILDQVNDQRVNALLSRFKDRLTLWAKAIREI